MPRLYQNILQDFLTSSVLQLKFTPLITVGEGAPSKDIKFRSGDPMFHVGIVNDDQVSIEIERNKREQAFSTRAAY